MAETEYKPSNESEMPEIKKFVQTWGGTVQLNPSIKEYIKRLADTYAKEYQQPVLVYTDQNDMAVGVPPPRPVPISEREPRDPEKAEQQYNDDEAETIGKDSPVEAASTIAGTNEIGTQDGYDDISSSAGLPGFSDIASAFKSGPARLLTGQIPSMEAILLNVPNELIGKFVQGLPPAFQSLLPAGALQGIVGSVINTAVGGGTISLNNLITSVAGAAAGSIAGQALRSIANVPAIPVGSELANALGTIPLNRAIPEVPLGTTNSSTAIVNGPTQGNAVLANVINTVTTSALQSISQGVPLNQTLLSNTVSIALQNSANQLSIPVSVLGVSPNVVADTIASAINSVIGAGVPLQTSNLSQPLATAVSGVVQNISANVAQTLIPTTQLQSLLPSNLQNAIPRIPTRLGSSYVPNPVAINRSSAQEVYPTSGERTPQEERKSTLEELKGTRLIGTERLSEHYTVDDLTTKPRLEKLTYIRGNKSLSISEIYENLKFLAENVLEPVRSKFPGMIINSGLRNTQDSSNHNKGLAVDLQWNAPNFSSMANRANWMYNNLAALNELFLESRGPANGSGSFWIHISVKQGNSGSPNAKTWYVSSNKQIPYSNGFVKGA